MSEAENDNTPRKANEVMEMREMPKLEMSGEQLLVRKMPKKQCYNGDLHHGERHRQVYKSTR